MLNKNKKRSFGYIALGVLLLTLFYFIQQKDFAIKAYVKLIKQSVSIVHHNRAGQLDGEFSSYRNGRIYQRGYFENGLREGLWIWYYENTGKIKYEVSYRRGAFDGPELRYYPSGKLNFKATFKNNKAFGSIYSYFENGKLNAYSAINIEGKRFCLLQFDQSGKIINTEGFVLSSDIYSVDSRDSIVLLNFNLNRDTGYTDVKDLCIMGVTPPGMHLTVNVTVNNRIFKNLSIENNIMTVPDAFIGKGTYRILIESHLLDESNHDVNGLDVERTIKIEE